MTRRALETPLTLGEVVGVLRSRLEAVGLFHYSSEPVCSRCPGQIEVGFVNVSWLATVATRPRQRGGGYVVPPG